MAEEKAHWIEDIWKAHGKQAPTVANVRVESELIKKHISRLYRDLKREAVKLTAISITASTAIGLALYLLREKQPNAQR